MTIRLALLFLLTAMPALAGAQSPKPGPEHKQLEAFVGTWNAEGQAQATPFGPAGKTVSVETFEWLPGGFFLTHRWETKQGGADLTGIEIIGFDPRSKAYTSRYFDNAGNSGWLRATRQGNAWTWTGDSDVAGKPTKERCTVILVNADVFTSKCEYSTDGAKWLPNFEQRNTRVK